MKTLIGTSGFSYKQWKGAFYPADVSPDEMLRHYADKFAAVEINNTFYRMPRAHVLEGWRDQVPETFRFAVKASRRITHLKRLADVEEPLGYLLEAVATLGARLGVVLYQLPPFMKKDLPRLEAFLAALPETPRAAMEFRNDSWFADDVYDALRARGVALCVADTDDGDHGEIVSTASFGYLRLRRPDYDDGALARWRSRVAAQPWDEAFVYFKHEDAGAGPAMAARFLELTPGADG